MCIKMRICNAGPAACGVTTCNGRMSCERCSKFFVLLTTTTLCLSVVGVTDSHGQGGVDKDIEFDAESVRRHLITDIDSVVKCRSVPGKVKVTAKAE